MEHILVKGSHFFTSKSSSPFLIRGIEYMYDTANSVNQSITAIPQLEDGLACRRDIPYLTSLGINTLLISVIRPSANGEIFACMEQLQKAGIYTVVGIGTLSLTIQSRQAWDVELMQRFTSVIDTFAGYDNVLGFYLTGSPITMPFVRGAVRDLKKYIRSKGRPIPIGYLGKLRGKDISNALNCDDQESSIDFLAFDLGSDCNYPSKSEPMMKKAIADHLDYSVPTFIHSPQCNPRKVANTTALDFLTQPNLTSVMSGAVVFSYFSYFRYDEFYGLMDITRGEVTPGPGIQRASSVYSSMRAATTDLYTPTITGHPSSCSTIITFSHSEENEATQTGYPVRIATNLPPSPDQRTCQCMMDSLDCVANHIYRPPSESMVPKPLEPAIVYEDEKQLVDSICPKNSSLCLGSTRDTVNGTFGAFSVCNSTERGSWILDRFYKASNVDAAACSSAGGTLRETGSARSLSNACKVVMKQAGPLGTGSVTPSLAFDDRSISGPRSSHTISEGAKAGIGIGIALVLALISAAVFLGLRGRKKKTIEEDTSPEEQVQENDVFGKAELPATTVAALKEKGELVEAGGDDLNELEADTKLKGVGPDGEMVELPGTEHKLTGPNAMEEVFELPDNEFVAVELDSNPNKPVVYERKVS